MSEYRHEFKYMVDSYDEQVILSKVRSVLTADIHSDPSGVYTVRSLYFDDIDDTCFYENDSGIDDRSKYRIRFYNDDPSVLRLEKKIKKHGMTRKESCLITADECSLLCRGGSIPLSDDPVKNNLFSDFLIRGLMPKVIVTYERIPFVYGPGNVRITFDTRLSASYEVDKFLECTYRRRAVYDPGNSILEVKFDDYLPRHIREMIQTDDLIRCRFSKYYMCRIYGI